MQRELVRPVGTACADALDVNRVADTVVGVPGRCTMTAHERTEGERIAVSSAEAHDREPSTDGCDENS